MNNKEFRLFYSSWKEQLRSDSDVLSPYELKNLCESYHDAVSGVRVDIRNLTKSEKGIIRRLREDEDFTFEYIAKYCNKHFALNLQHIDEETGRKLYRFARL